MDLYYKEYGDREASLLVFIHGGGVSSWMWDKQVDYFTNYHCVTVDLPAQGQNALKDEFTIEASAARINELIAGLANEKTVIVIGFSLGAQVLIQMLSDRSNLIAYAMINKCLRETKSARGKDDWSCHSFSLSVD